MIYKNGIKVKKIELIVNEENFICHLHLSNNKVWSGKPEKINPSILHNQSKLETFSILTITRTIELLKKEMEK